MSIPGVSPRRSLVALTLAATIWASGVVHPQDRAPRWSFTGDLVTPRRGSSSTLLQDGRVLVVGGTAADGRLLTSCELYDPSRGTWTTTGELNVGRMGHTAILFPDGKVLVMGGLSAADIRSTIDTTELYDPTSGTWRTVSSTIRADGSTTLLADATTVLIAGSHTADAGLARSSVLYDAATDSSRSSGQLETPRALHTATLLRTGQVLVTGGHTHPIDVGLTSSELYDPMSGSWVTTGSLAEGRFEHSETLLSDGRVLVVGGWSVGFTRLSTAELYDPASGTWSSAGSLRDPRTTNSPATLLADGRVLVVGGALGPPASTPPLNSAEIYDPLSGTWSVTASPGPRRGAVRRCFVTAGFCSSGPVTIEHSSAAPSSSTREPVPPAPGVRRRTRRAD